MNKIKKTDHAVLHKGFWCLQPEDSMLWYLFNLQGKFLGKSVLSLGDIDYNFAGLV